MIGQEVRGWEGGNVSGFGEGVNVVPRGLWIPAFAGMTGLEAERYRNYRHTYKGLYEYIILNQLQERLGR